MNPQASIATDPAPSETMPTPPLPDMTGSIHTEPLDQLGDKLRSWRHTTRGRRRGRVLRSSCFDTSGSGSTLEDEGETTGHQTDETQGEEKDGQGGVSISGSASNILYGAGLTMEQEYEEGRCRCCIRHLHLQLEGNPKQDGLTADEHEGVTGCETAREIRALDSDLLLSAEIGLTLLTRLNTLQASYDPLLISHTTLQKTYAELARTNHSHSRRQAEMEKDLQEKERERERLEKELLGGREREEGLEREVKRLEGRLRRFNLAGQRLRTGADGGEDRDRDHDRDPDPGIRAGETSKGRSSTEKKTQEEWEQDLRTKETVVMDLVAQNALLQHQLDRARLPIQPAGSKSVGNSPALGYSPTVPQAQAGERSTADETEKRKKLQRLSLGYRSGSYSGPYSSTPASASSSTGPVGLGFGIGRGTRHHSENALWTLNSASGSGSTSTPVTAAGDDPENDAQGGSTKRGKLRPLSLSLSVSSRFSHAGPSASSGVMGNTAEDAGHARRVSMAASLRSTTSAQAGQVHDRDHWKSPRESWVSSSTGIGMGAGGWDPDSIVRDADGTPVWPQPSRQVTGAMAPPAQAQPGTNGWRSGSGSGSETTSPRISMRAGAGSVGYSLNGVKRSMSVDRSSRGGIRRASGNQTVESIAETTGQDETHERSTSNATSEMLSDPASGTTRQRKRMSRYFHTPAYRPPTSPLINEEFSFAASSEPDSMVEGDRTSDSERPEERPSRMVDSKSTQTEPEPEIVREETPRMKHDAQVRLTLAGLGIEEDTPNSSSRTTPQLSAAFSPASPFNPSHHAREIIDSRTGALLALIEHVSKILLRLRQADVPNLTRRLKKHHLAGGDVGHLSRGEMKALEKEIGDMRTHFRSVVEDERRLGNGKNPLHDSMITKKDFQLLLKLFKEIFGELIELRGIVNDVTVNPAVAVELRKRQEAIQAEEEEARGRGKAVKNAGGLGWIAAPITKLFAAPSSDPPTKRASDKALLQPPAIRSSAKLMPSTSATTTQVSVEFASTGQIRRATAGLPAVNKDHMDELPVSPSDTLTKIPGISRQAIARPARTPAISLGDGSIRGPPPGNNRQSLYGIFAGGAQGVPPRMNQTVSGRPALGRHRRQLSTVVDAVIDDDGPDRGLDDYQPPLLERTLRPRGLSDSSIRTTFQHHGIEIPAGRDDQPAPNLYGSYWPATSVVKTLGRRIQALTGGTQPLPPSSMSTSTTDDSSLSQDTTVVASPDMTTTTNATLQVKHNEPRAIIRKRSANQLGPSPASLTDGGGFLSMLSSSSTNEPHAISSKHSSPGMQRSESRTRRSRAHLQS